MKEWEKDLPRAQYQLFPKIEQSQKWFEVYDIGYDVLAIYEPYQFQEVISYLIKGKDKALLLDTGMGIGNMKELVEELWDQEYLVCNTHHHFDHIGNDYLFPLVHVFNHPDMIKALNTPLSEEIMEREYSAKALSDISPIEEVKVRWGPSKYETFKENDIFDLVNRQLKVIHTPGHSKDSICLVDETNKLLFTGDTYYPATLYCFEDTFQQYVQTMHYLADNYSNYTLITSHNEPIREGKVLKEVAYQFDQVLRDLLPKSKVGNYYLYQTNGFSLLK